MSGVNLLHLCVSCMCHLGGCNLFKYVYLYVVCLCVCSLLVCRVVYSSLWCTSVCVCGGNFARGCEGVDSLWSPSPSAVFVERIFCVPHPRNGRGIQVHQFFDSVLFPFSRGLKILSPMGCSVLQCGYSLSVLVALFGAGDGGLQLTLYEFSTGNILCG